MRKSRGLQNRVAVTCTPPNVGNAHQLVDELLDSAS